MVEVRRVSVGVMYALLPIDEDVLRLSCGYAPQSGKNWKNKNLFL